MKESIKKVKYGKLRASKKVNNDFEFNRIKKSALSGAVEGEKKVQVDRSTNKHHQAAACE